MAHRIELRPAAVEALSQVDPSHQARIKAVISLLAIDPQPLGAVSLRWREALRVEVGDYRIIYTAQDGVLLVVVVTAGHHHGAYQ